MLLPNTVKHTVAKERASALFGNGVFGKVASVASLPPQQSVLGYSPDPFANSTSTDRYVVAPADVLGSYLGPPPAANPPYPANPSHPAFTP